MLKPDHIRHACNRDLQESLYITTTKPITFMKGKSLKSQPTHFPNFEFGL